MSAPIAVLYAEDNPADTDLTRAHFARAAPEFSLEVAHDAGSFLARARRREHALLLLDQRLPDMDGIDVLRTLMQERIDTPVVMITGVGDSELATQALRLGAHDYVPKRPGYLDHLPAKLREVLGRRHQPAGAAPHRAVPRRVLLIDDEPSAVSLVIEHLARSAPHITVAKAHDSEQALALLQADAGFDLLICDYLLPGMNGLELIAEIRRRGLNLPFILVTGLGNEDIVVAALRLGASDYLLKHGRYYAELALRIELAIDRHRLQLANDRAATELAERQRALSALRASEQQLSLAIAAGRIGLWSWEPATNRVYFSSQWKALLGYADHELRNHPDEWLSRCHPADRRRMLTLRTRYLAKPWADYTAEYRLRHRDGSWRWFLLHADLDRDEAGRPVCMRGSQIDITELKHHQAELDRASAQLHRLSRRLLDVQETERRHLARELHDEIGQVLTATKLQLESAALHPEPERATAQFKDAVALLDRLLAQVRSLTLDLRPPLLDDLGLVPALHWLVGRQQSRAATPRVRLLADPAMTRCEPAIETACFRIAQEALTNALRHAAAQSITLTLDREDNTLRLSVRDDGRGFDVEAARFRAEQSGSLGLLGMTERLALAGGTFTLRSSPHRGTRIEAVFPLSPPPPPPGFSP
jgi:two-component system sensor histidine kinase UhpB